MFYLAVQLMAAVLDLRRGEIVGKLDADVNQYEVRPHVQRQYLLRAFDALVGVNQLADADQQAFGFIGEPSGGAAKALVRRFLCPVEAVQQ